MVRSQLSKLSIDQLDRARRRMLLGFLIGFLAWQLPQIIQDTWGNILPAYLEMALVVAALAGLAAFLYYGWQIVQLGKLAKEEPAVNEALNDERVRCLRLQAIEAGFWTLVIYMGAVRLGGLVTTLPTGAGPFMQLGLVVAASSAILSYLWLDRDKAS